MNRFEETYAGILAARPAGRKTYAPVEPAAYRDRLRAALLARLAGCTLGAPVEGWSIEQMEKYAAELKLPFPLENYWTATPIPDEPRYLYDTFKSYTLPHLNAVPCDDDVGYTLLSLFIAEESGKGRAFTLEDVAQAWLKYITLAYTAEDAALKNLQAGVDIYEAAEKDNPYTDLIGADIRCDGYGYMAPGNPELAARMAYTDAYISHRNEGIYGSMYFAAVLAIGFATGDVYRSLCDGLLYIPENCELAAGLRWALDLYGKVRDYRHAAALVDERYPGMHSVHTINNACLTVFGLSLGENDCGRAFSECVAMAHDNDCTAATAGSIAGACLGTAALEEKWFRPFGGRIRSYFNGPREYEIEDILKRYEKIALEPAETPSARA